MVPFPHTADACSQDGCLGGEAMTEAEMGGKGKLSYVTGTHFKMQVC